MASNDMQVGKADAAHMGELACILDNCNSSRPLDAAGGYGTAIEDGLAIHIFPPALQK